MTRWHSGERANRSPRFIDLLSWHKSHYFGISLKEGKLVPDQLNIPYLFQKPQKILLALTGTGHFRHDTRVKLYGAAFQCEAPRKIIAAGKPCEFTAFHKVEGRDTPAEFLHVQSISLQGRKRPGGCSQLPQLVYGTPTPTAAKKDCNQS